MTEIPTSLPPAWGRTNLDEESLVLITLELQELLKPEAVGGPRSLRVDDSRAFVWLCREAAIVFQSFTELDNKDYWAERDYTNVLLEFCHLVSETILQEPDWINDQAWHMYGNETLPVLLTRRNAMDKLRELFVHGG